MSVPGDGVERPARGAGADRPEAGLPPVLLLHGLWNSAAWLGPLAWRLRRAGFAPRRFGYRSAADGPEAAASSLVERLRDWPGAPPALVGHSLGGIVALRALALEPALPVVRVVCLGSPLCGSAAAAALARNAWGARLLGRAGACLVDTGLPADPLPVPVGMVAGTRAAGLGRMLADLGEISDGTVGLAETRWPGLADHCRVAVGHAGLLTSPQAARQVVAFLRHGRFEAG